MDKQAQEKLVRAVQRSLVDRYGSGLGADSAQLASLVREHAGVISDLSLLEVLRALRNDSTGVGILEPLVCLPEVTDVLVNGPRQVWVDRGKGLVKSDICFSNEADIRRLATRLVVNSGGRLDDSHPYADARLPRLDGTTLRIHAVIPPLAHGGTCLSLRVLRPSSLDLQALIARGAVAPAAASHLRKMLEKRAAFLIVGGTGSGKTTLLAALLQSLPATERLVCIEDTPELSTSIHPHLVPLAARGANVEGRGEISLTMLLRQALRMRPDRIIVGEIRGGEIVDLLSALNTGHEGGAGTLHANNLEEVPARLEALCALGGLGRKEAHSQILAAVKNIVVMQRTPAGQRELTHIGRLFDSGGLAVETIWEK
ncbi:TadA family conjugal transfer-associated ATPase [Corynebacterium caspium]|uniref:TadA family conjugal transfer-associated ATPase n=1 Tax=Corynebacterium caspium TaxID=234828 RepID=UPI0003765732|nr:TadA family conjugal transfer-associated ATPase [Corynebacterium caspium]WKD58573.1 Putative conjugal transfer protein [Corynebacterium caspium DSM 44850]